MFQFQPQDVVEKIPGGDVGEVKRVYADGTLWAEFNGVEELISYPDDKLVLLQRLNSKDRRPVQAQPEDATPRIGKMTPLPDKTIYV